MKNAGFELTKWYMDCSNEKGDFYIGYWAKLNWLGLEFYYYNDLWKDHTNDKIFSKGNFSFIAEPVFEDSQLLWRNSEWKSMATPVSYNLFPESSANKVNWICTQPKAKVTIDIPTYKFEGYGYTECIKLHIEPWKLQMEILYWGRIISTNHTVVFIITEGKEYQNIYFQDSSLYPSVCTVTDKVISAQSFKFECNEKISIREGKLIDNVFNSFKDIKKLPVVKTFFAEEHKWFSKGQLTINDITEVADIIYEKVIL